MAAGLFAGRFMGASQVRVDVRQFPAALQPGDTEEIDDADFQAVPGAVMRGAMRARMVADGNRDDTAAGADEQGRQEAVDMVEMREFQEGRAAEQFQAAAGIGRAVLQKFARGRCWRCASPSAWPRNPCG